MALLLRAITTTPPELTPVEGAERFDVDGLSVWVTQLPDESRTFTREDMLAHHRVVTAVFERVEAILPARFPTWFEALAISAHRDALARQLDVVRGCCEFALTALWTTADAEPAPVAADAPGRRYLLTRRSTLAGSDRRRERARAIADEIEGSLGSDLQSARRQLCPSPNVALSSALLVRRANAEHARLRLRRTDRDVRILVNGPWPPYSFAAVRSE